MVRITALPAPALPITSTERASASASTTSGIQCLLHSGRLAAEERLHVEVNGLPLIGVPEGEQWVFAWQLSLPSDEVRITKRRRGSVLKYWQGGWNGDDAIAGTGTLPVEVIWSGKPQPASKGASPSVPPAEALSSSFEEARTQHNGRDAQDADHVLAFPLASASSALLETQEDVQVEEEEEELEAGTESSGVAPLVLPEASSLAHHPALSTYQQVVAFYASPFLREQDQTLLALKQLVAQMPPKTILVDLRERPKSRKYTPGGLSKEVLRAVFGAKYWDRGWAIPTTLHPVPSSRGGPIPSWQAMLTTPFHPDGIPALVKFYQQGYSFILMDSRVPYEESARRAVIEALKEALPDLVVGSLT
jgi:hypothetical protein